jgi:hypothetical protein
VNVQHLSAVRPALLYCIDLVWLDMHVSLLFTTEIKERVRRAGRAAGSGTVRRSSSASDGRPWRAVGWKAPLDAPRTFARGERDQHETFYSHIQSRFSEDGDAVQPQQPLSSRKTLQLESVATCRAAHRIPCWTADLSAAEFVESRMPLDIAAKSPQHRALFYPGETCTTADPMTASLPPKKT